MNAIIDNVMYHIPANLQGFYLKAVSEKEYILQGVIDGVTYDIDKDCGLEHEYPVYLTLAEPMIGTLKFDGFGGVELHTKDGDVESVWMERNEYSGICKIVLDRDLTTKEDLREMIEESSTMEDWEKKHFLEWVTVQEGVAMLNHPGCYMIFDQEELDKWVERYYRRDVTMLTDFVLENLIEQELDLHFQSPHPQSFKEFSADHALVPVERPSKFAAVKGDTVVVFNGRSWKIIYVF